MLNKLEALKVFCVTAETLQFKEAANRLAVSPPVVTRVVAELEDYLGEPLFQRNTRQVRLTDFGRQFLPQVRQLMEDTERLFEPAARRHSREMEGLVRITVPPDLPDEAGIVAELLARLEPYPKLVLDWRKSEVRLNAVEAQIDMGVRISHFSDSRVIARKVGETVEKIVASPKLLERIGRPRDLADLQKNFPLAGIWDNNTGRVWNWYINENNQFVPNNPVFVGSDEHTVLQAALSARVVAFPLDWIAEPYLQSGELVELFAEIPKHRWPVHVYRPQRTVTPVRVLAVFDWLTEMVRKRFQAA